MLDTTKSPPPPQAPEEPAERSPGSLGRVLGTIPSAYHLLVMLIVGGVLFLIVYPLARTGSRVFYPGGRLDLSPIDEVTTASWFSTTLRDTALAVGGACLLALLIGASLAWLNERTDANFGLLGEILPIIPLLIPPVAIAVGWTLLALPGVGFLSVAVERVLGIQVDIHSWAGLIWVYTLYLVPFIYLIVGAALRNLDPSLEEASRISGAGIWRTVWRVSLPSIRPAMFSAGVLALIVGLSSYSVPVIIAENAGIDIVSVRIIRMLKVVYPPRTGPAVVLSVFLFLAIMAAWLLQRGSVRGGNFARVGGRSARSGRFELGPWRWVARGCMAAYIGSACILPLLALIVVALQPYWTPTINVADFGLHNFRELLFQDRIAADALRFSMTLGAVGGAVGMAIASVVVLYIHSARASTGSIVDAVTKFPGALSNIVIGVGFLFAFSGPPFNLSGTLLLLFLAYLTIYMPQASIAAGAAVSQVGTELSEASYVSGAGEGRTVRSIMLPLMLPGLVSGWALLFVLMATELAASSLLAGVGNPVIGFVIIEIWSAGTYGKLAAFATTVTLLSAAVIAVAFTASRWLRRGYV